MDEHQCVNCGTVLPRTGTFCLACNTPVEGAVRGLSVGETEVVHHGRPVVAVGLGAIALVALLGTGWLLHHLMQGHPEADARAAAVSGTTYLVHAEGGHRGACPFAAAYLTGKRKTVLSDCYALVDADPGVKIERLHAARTELTGSRGTVELRGTWVSAPGTARPFDRTVAVSDQGGSWAMVWDGKAVSPG